MEEQYMIIEEQEEEQHPLLSSPLLNDENTDATYQRSSGGNGCVRGSLSL